MGLAARRAEIADAIDLGALPAAVVAVPDGCVEHWHLADPPSFAQRFGEQPDTPRH